MYFIGKHQFNLQDILLYPSKEDDDFKPLLERVLKKIKTFESEKDFEMLPHQEELLRTISIYAPYRSFLFYHNMGSGKTITIILIIEQLKPFLIEHNTKALILVPNNMIQTTTFTKELLGKFNHQNKTQYRKWCTGNTYVTTRLRKLLNSTQTDSERKKIEKQILKEKISNTYEITTHKKWELYIHTLTDEQIKQEYSNRIIVVDEVQKAKNSGSQFYSILERVLRVASNNYLFVLSGTPMVDDPIELCQPINLCRINEGLVDLLDAKTIKNYYSTNVEKSKQAKIKIAKLCKGFISRVKGINSIGCPIRIDAGECIGKEEDFIDDIDISADETAHTASSSAVTVTGGDDVNNTNNVINIGEKLMVVYSRLHGKQLKEYLKEFMIEFLTNNDSDPNEMWNNSRRICRGIWGESEILSQKFHDIWDRSRPFIGKGVILNYSFYINDGIMPFERFLLSKRETAPFDGSGQPSNKEIVFNFSNLKTEHFKTQVTDIIGNYDNYNGKIVQWVLGTLKIGQGITMCMGDEVNLIESTWNLSTSEQFISRTIRFGTHTFPKYSEMYNKPWNNTVTVNRFCSYIDPEDFEKLPSLFKQQINHFIEQHNEALTDRGFILKQPNGQNRLLTIDEYIYRDTFDKHCRIINLDRFISKYAFHFTDLSVNPVVKDNEDSKTLNRKNSSLYWLLRLFNKNSIWTLDNLLLNLPPRFPHEQFIETLHRFVTNAIPFKLNNAQKIMGFIEYVDPNHYWYNCSSQREIPNTLPLSHFVEPNINLDDYFPMKTEPDLYIPTSFANHLFIIKSDLNLNLKKGEYAGVLENTENNPEVFQLKFCINDTESVCNDKYVTEIYTIAKKVGIVNPQLYGKNRKKLCDAIFDTLVKQNRILPWATKIPPNILRTYLIAIKYKETQIVSIIDDINSKMKQYQLDDFKKMYIDMHALQYPEQYKLHSAIIEKQIDQRFEKKVEKFPLYLLGVLSYLYSKRPKRFSENVWDITRMLRQKIESTYSSELHKIKILLYQLISNQINKK
jgi:hypothetical protein